MRICSLLYPLFLAASSLVAQDSTPPVVVGQSPLAGATLRALGEVEVFFSEPVTNVNAGDLLLNGVPATNVVDVTGLGDDFIFQFSPPPTGGVQVAFAAGHGIVDLATPANAFEGAEWIYTVNPNSPLVGIVLNEFMADNENGIRDNDGDRSDWIEIYNGAEAAADLTGWYLTDDPLDLRKWRLPNTGIAQGGYLLIYASSKNRTNNPTALHTNFRLSDNAGAFLALVDSTGSNIVSSFVNYPAQTADISYGRDRVDQSMLGFYSTPTPRAANAATGAGVLPEVEFSRASSTFVTSFTVTLSTPDTNALIRYILIDSATLARTNVFLTATSPVYAGPLEITGTMQLRARAFPKSGSFLPGPLRSESYLQINPNAVNFSSDLPLIIIHSMGQGAYPAVEGAQTELNSIIAVIDANTERSALTNHPVIVRRAGINSRGSSTLGYAKKSLAVELWDEFNDGVDVEVLGMPAESDWTLYGPNNFEPSLVHNPLFYKLSNDMGRYASRTRYVEVFLHESTVATGAVGTNNYNGIYVLAERPKRAAGRVNIEGLDSADTNAPAVTGGYLLSVDRVDTAQGEATFSTPTVGVVPAQTVIYKYPRSQDILLPERDPQEQYIRGFFGAFVTNLASTNFAGPAGYVQYIDPESWIDHLIVNVAALNLDAMRLSGFFHKDRNKRIEMGPVWDCDRCFGSTDGRSPNPRTWRSTVSDFGTDFFNYPWWGRMFTDANFWQLYIDRYQNFRRGPLSQTNIFGRIDEFAAEIAEAYPREFAKFRVAPRGTNGTGSGTYATEIQWTKNWLAARLEFMDTNFLQQTAITLPGGAPAVEGLVTNGHVVLLTPPNQVGGQNAASTNAVVYYTLDGTDPRAPGGSVAPGALSNLGPVSITITGNVRIVARSFNPRHRNLTGANNPPLSSSWSGTTEASFWLGIPPLRITEIMYHPADPVAGNTNAADNFEYIEVRNTGAVPLNVNHFRLRGGVDFDFPNATLAAGERAVIVRHLAAFQSRYGNTPRVLGVYINDSLANSEDNLILQGLAREPILDFTYDDDWYPSTDGLGFSLEIVNDAAATSTWGLASSWRPSGQLNGTPGLSDPGIPSIPAVFVNEVLSNTDPAPGDAVELHNSSASPADISGWFLTDNFNSPKKYRIPNGTIIPANGYIVFYQSNSFGVGTGNFALSSKGEELYLFSAAADGSFTGWAHGFSFGPQANGVTFGRHVDTTGTDHFVAQRSATLGSANSGPLITASISEINYHPPDLIGRRGVVDNSQDEYIEIHNSTASPLPLYDPAHPANTWRLRDAVDFTFPPGVILPAGGYALVVSFDPSDTIALANFRLANGVPDSTPVYGPWIGELNNAFDNVELTRPDLPDAPGTPSAGVVSQILVDKVDYQDSAPWPFGLPDGLGAVIGRVNVAGFGNDPGNWRTAPKTPGAALPGGGAAPTILTQPSNQVGIEGQSATFSLTASGEGLGYIWTFNGRPVSGASSPNLTLTGLRDSQVGIYACYVFNSAGAVVSADATLSIRHLPRITQNPESRNVYIKPDPKAANLPNGTNVTFTVAAASFEPPIQYQWRFNGVDVPGATGPSLTVTNVQLENEGDYYCVVTDGVASVNTFSARLVPWLSPVIIQRPADLIVAAGSEFPLSVEVSGNPAPFAYSWRRNLGSVVVNTNSGPYKTNFIVLTTEEARLILTNNIMASNFVMRIVIYNDANRAPGATTTFNITVLEDTDRDGIPDVVEQGLGLDTNNVADAASDLDLDGMSNRAEFVAGTDPANNQSYLRVDATVTAGTSTVAFAGISNRTYTVQFIDNLNAAGWSTLSDIAARNTNFTQQIADPSWTTNRLYRVVTPRQ